MGQDCDSRFIDTYNKRTRRSTLSATGESFCISWTDDADHEYSSDVEDQEADEEGPGGLGQVAARGLHLSRCDDEQLRCKAEWESCCNNSGDKRNEPTRVARYDPCVESARISPIAEVERVARGSSAKEQYDAEN